MVRRFWVVEDELHESSILFGWVSKEALQELQHPTRDTNLCGWAVSAVVCRPSQARVLIRFALEMRSNERRGRANLFFHTNLNCKLSLSYSLRSLSVHVEGHPLHCVEFWVQIMRNWRWKVNRARIAWWFWEIQWKFCFMLCKLKQGHERNFKLPHTAAWWVGLIATLP